MLSANLSKWNQKDYNLELCDVNAETFPSVISHSPNLFFSFLLFAGGFLYWQTADSCRLHFVPIHSENSRLMVKWSNDPVITLHTRPKWGIAIRSLTRSQPLEINAVSQATASASFFLLFFLMFFHTKVGQCVKHS